MSLVADSATKVMITVGRWCHCAQSERQDPGPEGAAVALVMLGE
jgi:hypothetical protein